MQAIDEDTAMLEAVDCIGQCERAEIDQRLDQDHQHVRGTERHNVRRSCPVWMAPFVQGLI